MPTGLLTLDKLLYLVVGPVSRGEEYFFFTDEIAALQLPNPKENHFAPRLKGRESFSSIYSVALAVYSIFFNSVIIQIFAQDEQSLNSDSFNVRFR